MQGDTRSDRTMQAPARDMHERYRAGRTKKALLIGGMATLLFIAILYAGAVGSANLSLWDVFLSLVSGLVSLINGVLSFASGHLPGAAGLDYRLDPSLFTPHDDVAETIVLNIRLPRILLAVLAGACLAIAGAVMQGVLRNPLVSPFTLGLSSAASFGAALAIVAGPGIFGAVFASNDGFIVASAFVFGLASMLLVYAVTRMSDDQSTIILAGVVLGYLFSAGVMILKYLTDNDKLRDITLWLMGGMWGASWGSVVILTPIAVAGFLLLTRRSWDLNALAAGDEVARNLGVNVGRVRLWCLLLATFVASSCLAFTGVIGFIGLMAPHICRMLMGNDYRFLLPGSALLGALILLVSDTFARTILSPQDLPVGVVMYVLGGIFFLVLIGRGKKSLSF